MPLVALVTGSSSGIGRATAVALSKAGFAVVLSGRRQAELEATVQLAGGEAVQDRLLVVAGDINDEEGVKALFEKAVAKFSRVDIVFNNAGVDGGGGAFIEDVPVSEFDRVFATNVRAAWMVTQAAVRQFKAQSPQGGRIINNGSISAHAPRPNSSLYTCSKHAIMGLTKCTQLDGREFNIACSQIDIGNASTSLGSTSAPKRQSSGHMLVEPSFAVDEVAEAVVFIASQKPGTNVSNMTIMATNMPFVGRG